MRPRGRPGNWLLSVADEPDYPAVQGASNRRYGWNAATQHSTHWAPIKIVLRCMSAQVGGEVAVDFRIVPSGSPATYGSSRLRVVPVDLGGSVRILHGCRQSPANARRADS